MKKLFFFTLCAAIVVYACSQKAGMALNDSNSKYKLTAFTKSLEYKDASIDAMTYQNGKMNFTIGGSAYKLGEQTSDSPLKMCANSAKGQHIHVIVDNKPYDAKYDAAFDYSIDDGDHYLMTFLSRSYHESIKTEKAHRALKINVKNKSIVSGDPITAPMLFYSRPKGDYIGEKETQKVMLDFYPINATIGKEYKIKAEINGEVHMIDKWQPYYIEGLPLGENKVKLTLTDKFGNPVKTPLNPVERTFNLKADPATGK